MEQAAQYLENLHFDESDIAYLRSLEMFSEEYLSYLAKLRFTGDVRAVREGEIVFPYEPIVTVSAPMLEAQLLLAPAPSCTRKATQVAPLSLPHPATRGYHHVRTALCGYDRSARPG